jgi:hypothetical protein
MVGVVGRRRDTATGEYNTLALKVAGGESNFIKKKEKKRETEERERGERISTQ